MSTPRRTSVQTSDGMEVLLPTAFASPQGGMALPSTPPTHLIDQHPAGPSRTYRTPSPQRLLPESGASSTTTGTSKSSPTLTSTQPPCSSASQTPPCDSGFASPLHVGSPTLNPRQVMMLKQHQAQHHQIVASSSGDPALQCSSPPPPPPEPGGLHHVQTIPFMEMTRPDSPRSGTNSTASSPHHQTTRSRATTMPTGTNPSYLLARQELQARMSVSRAESSCCDDSWFDEDSSRRGSSSSTLLMFAHHPYFSPGPQPSSVVGPGGGHVSGGFNSTGYSVPEHQALFSGGGRQRRTSDTSSTGSTSSSHFAFHTTSSRSLLRDQHSQTLNSSDTTSSAYRVLRQQGLGDGHDDTGSPTTMELPLAVSPLKTCEPRKCSIPAIAIAPPASPKDSINIGHRKSTRAHPNKNNLTTAHVGASHHRGGKRVRGNIVVGSNGGTESASSNNDVIVNMSFAAQIAKLASNPLGQPPTASNSGNDLKSRSQQSGDQQRHQQQQALLQQINSNSSTAFTIPMTSTSNNDKLLQVSTFDEDSDGEDCWAEDSQESMNWGEGSCSSSTSQVGAGMGPLLALLPGFKSAGLAQPTLPTTTTMGSNRDTTIATTNYPSSPPANAPIIPSPTAATTGKQKHRHFSTSANDGSPSSKSSNAAVVMPTFGLPTFVQDSYVTELGSKVQVNGVAHNPQDANISRSKNEKKHSPTQQQSHRYHHHQQPKLLSPEGSPGRWSAMNNKAPMPPSPRSVALQCGNVRRPHGGRVRSSSGRTIIASPAPAPLQVAPNHSPRNLALGAQPLSLETPTTHQSHHQHQQPDPMSLSTATINWDQHDDQASTSLDPLTMIGGSGFAALLKQDEQMSGSASASGHTLKKNTTTISLGLFEHNNSGTGRKQFGPPTGVGSGSGGHQKSDEHHRQQVVSPPQPPTTDRMSTTTSPKTMKVQQQTTSPPTGSKEAGGGDDVELQKQRDKAAAVAAIIRTASLPSFKQLRVVKGHEDKVEHRVGM